MQTLFVIIHFLSILFFFVKMREARYVILSVNRWLYLTEILFND